MQTTEAPATYNELWTVYDRDGQPTAEKILKSEFRKHPEMYRLAADIWIMNSKGQFLIQRRSLNLRHFPGYWSPTSGSVMHGETSRQAIVRETEEELGLTLNPDDCTLMLRMRSGNVWIDSYFIQKDIELTSLRLCPREVDEVDWMSSERLDNLARYYRLIPPRWLYVREICVAMTRNINLTDVNELWRAEALSAGLGTR